MKATLATVCVVAIATWFTDCKEAVPAPAQEAAVAKDAFEQKECVEKYATKAEIDKCRDAVKAKRDAGQ